MKILEHEYAIGIIFLIVISFTVFCISQWSYIQEGEILGKWAYVTTILSVISTFPIYFSKNYIVIKREKLHIIENLCYELKDAQDGLDKEKHKGDVTKQKLQGKKFSYIERFLNDDIYQSLMHSGKINLLPIERQQDTQNIFKIIRERNYYLKRTHIL